MCLYYTQLYWILNYAGLSCLCLDRTWCFWVIISKYALPFLSTPNETHQQGLQTVQSLSLSPHHISFSIISSTLSPFLAHWPFLSASYHVPASCMENYFLTVTWLTTVLLSLSPSWKTSLPDCATCSYNKLLYYHVLHITASILHLCLVWLSFYSTILRAPWGQRWGWVLSLVLRNLPDGEYSINIYRMNERMNEWVTSRFTWPAPDYFM